jgi:Ca2+-binding EF-hand superfamily protein
MASMVLPSLSSLVSNPTPKRTPSTPLQELFDMVDSDGSGGISPEEFVTLMVRML